MAEVDGRVRWKGASQNCAGCWGNRPGLPYRPPLKLKACANTQLPCLLFLFGNSLAFQIASKKVQTLSLAALFLQRKFHVVSVATSACSG